MAARRRSRHRSLPVPARPQARPPRSRRPGWVVALALVLIAAAGAFAYATSFRGTFVLDDVRAIVRNQSIRTLWPLSVPLSPPSESTVAGRPVANLSFALSYAMGPAAEVPAAAGTPVQAAQLDPRPFHVGNLLIHVLAGLTLFGVVRRTLLTPRLAPVFDNAASWAALGVALVWVVHPLTTAAVTYLVQRVESLMGLFYLLTLYGAIRAAGSPRAGWWTAAAEASCAAGMATKETMVTAPLTVALWDYLFVKPADRQSFKVRWRLVGGLAATWVMLAFLVQRQFRGPSISLAPDMIWLYARTQAEVVVHYLRLAFVPAPLVFFYDWPLVPAPIWTAWQAALLTALAALTAVGVARRHPASFLGAWFFLILAPSSSILPIVTEVAAEHRMYLPLAAVVAAVVVAGFQLSRRWMPSPKVGLGVAAISLAACAGLLAVETRARNRAYWSAETLWGDTVTKRPNDARARVAYGEALAAAGRLAEAEAQLEKGLALSPGDPVAHVRMGAVLAQQQKIDAAIRHLEQALALRPGDVDAHRFLAEIYALRRQDSLGAGHYEQALATLPGDPQLLGRLALLLAESRDPNVRNASRATELAGRAVRLTGGRDPRLLEVLSASQAATGAFAQAAATARAAAEVARALGSGALAASLAYRAAAYEQAARQPFAPVR